MKHAQPRAKALLLAAGLGLRLRPLTDSTPKCLIPVAGRPLLDYWLDALEQAEIRDALINTHHLSEQVRSHVSRVNSARGFRVAIAHEDRLLGSAGTLHANRGWMDDADECVIIYTDNFSAVDLSAMLAFHRAHGDPATMLLFRAAEPSRCGIVELDDAQRVVSFTEKPAAPKSDLANAGVYVIRADAYREMADLNAFDIGFDVLPRFVGRMHGWVCAGYHRDIGTLEGLRDAERAARALYGAALELQA